MKMEELAIKGAWLATSPIIKDDRGLFREWFRFAESRISDGAPFKVMQSNVSLSNKGVLRGIHYSLAREGQGKWVTCVSGSIWDVVVDIRPSSSTYKKWIGIHLNAHSGDSIYISPGLGHGFMALEDNTVVTYLLTSPYSPNDEFEISPIDLDLGISWPIKDAILSQKDARAKSLNQMFSEGKLPS